MTVEASTRALKVIRFVWVIGFVIGTTTHTLDLIVGGLDAYSAFPLSVRLFWVSLTFLDAATVALILLRRRCGIVLGFGVMVADIIVNWTVFAVVGRLSLFGVISQSLFALFIFLSAPSLWVWFGRADQGSSILRP